MKRFAAALGLLLPGLSLLVSAGAARADDAPGCSVGSTNILGGQDKDAKGDVTINCTAMTENFGNKLAEVLNRILQNRLDPQAVLARLDEVDSVPMPGVARTVNENQRHQIIQSLSGKLSAT